MEWISVEERLPKRKYSDYHTGRRERVEVRDRVILLKQIVEQASIYCGLNLTVYDGKIGFVDQEKKKIVATWNPEFSFKDL